MGTRPSGDGRMQMVPPVMMMSTRDSGKGEGGASGVAAGVANEVADEVVAAGIVIGRPGTEWPGPEAELAADILAAR